LCVVMSPCQPFWNGRAIARMQLVAASARMIRRRTLGVYCTSTSATPQVSKHFRASGIPTVYRFKYYPNHLPQLVVSRCHRRIARDAPRSSSTRQHRHANTDQTDILAALSDNSAWTIQSPILCRCSLYCDVALQTATHTCINRRLHSPHAAPMRPRLHMPPRQFQLLSLILALERHHSSSSPSSGSYPALLRVMYHHPTLSAATRRTIPTPERVSTSQPHLRGGKSVWIPRHKHWGTGKRHGMARAAGGDVAGIVGS
jgi:hypothetical protein